MRSGVLPGGLLLETGCWTQLGDATLYIPTHFTKCVSIIVNADITGGGVDGIPDVSSGFIKVTLNADGNGKILNYVAFGF